MPSPRAMTPITINNHFPEHYQYKGSEQSSKESSNMQKGSPLDIDGHLDVGLKDYSKWQESRFENPSLQAEVRKANDALLAEGIDLQQVGQEYDFLVKEKHVKRGIARCYVDDVPIWLKRLKKE